MAENFTLKHNDNKEGNVLKFTPFCLGERKAKVIAVKFRKFMRNHMSSTQYDAILRELIQDLEILQLQTSETIIVKRDRL